MGEGDERCLCRGDFADAPLKTAPLNTGFLVHILLYSEHVE